MELTYFGHSAFQIETNGTTLLVDPFITDNPHTEGVVTADELEPDYILLTHAHSDHWGDTPDIATRTGAQVVGNFEIVQYIQQQHDHENVQPMNTGGSWSFDWGEAKQTYARHSSSFPDGTYGGNPNGYLLEIEGQTIYDLGDTALFAGMEWVGDDHDIDLALIPIGDCFTMGLEDAVEAAELLQPDRVIPIHYDTFGFIEVDIDHWQQLMDEVDIDTEVLDPGETLTL